MNCPVTQHKEEEVRCEYESISSGRGKGIGLEASEKKQLGQLGSDGHGDSCLQPPGGSFALAAPLPTRSMNRAPLPPTSSWNCCFTGMLRPERPSSPGLGCLRPPGVTERSGLTSVQILALPLPGWTSSLPYQASINSGLDH